MTRCYLVGFAVVLSGCAISVEPAPEPTWCVDGATPAEGELVAGAMAEWNQRAGTDLAVADNCTRWIAVVDLLETNHRLGEWDGTTAWVVRPQSGVPRVDALVFWWTVAHELGHALGAAHTAHEQDVMFAFSRFQEQLTANDVAALRASQSSRSSTSRESEESPCATSRARPHGSDRDATKDTP